MLMLKIGISKFWDPMFQAEMCPGIYRGSDVRGQLCGPITTQFHLLCCCWIGKPAPFCKVISQ
jgi:hypothetical protein